jgi:hypothetical protein
VKLVCHSCLDLTLRLRLQVKRKSAVESGSGLGFDGTIHLTKSFSLVKWCSLRKCTPSTVDGTTKGDTMHLIGTGRD